MLNFISDRNAAATTAFVGLLGVHGPDGSNAGLVLGGMSSHGERVSRVLEDGLAPAQPFDSHARRDLAAEQFVVD